MDLKQRAKRLKTDVPALFLCLKSREIPPAAKILGIITVAYALSPIDLIPDFIPVLGYLDDLIILPALISLTVKLVPKDVLEKCRLQAQGLWDGKKPKKWYYALPIAAIWLVVLWLIVKRFL